MSFYFDKEMIKSVDDAIGEYSAGEFSSPTRSTVPLLSWLKHESTMLNKLLADLRMPERCDLHLEYTVAPLQGEGTPSHTDLMIRSGNSVLAVEAKWTEPRYETVGTWLKSKGANGKNVLEGWIRLLQQEVQYQLNISDFSGSIYQMVHRAASACAVGGDPRLVYLVFKPSPDPRTASSQQIKEDLKHLWDLLGGPGRYPFYLVEIPLDPTPAFNAIAALPKQTTGTVSEVVLALKNKKLFDFGPYKCTKIK